MRLLNAEEIIKAINDGSVVGGTLVSMNDNFSLQMQGITKAQRQLDLNNYVEWLYDVAEKLKEHIVIGDAVGVLHVEIESLKRLGE